MKVRLMTTPTIVRLFDQYTERSASYFLSDRTRLIDQDRYTVISVYLVRRSAAPNPLERDGIRCYYLSEKKESTLTLAYKLSRLLKENHVDILHCHKHRPTKIGVFASVFARVPFVVTHIHGKNRCRTIGRKLFYLLFSWKISLAIGCSESTSRDVVANFPGISTTKTRTLLNSIDYERYAVGSTNRVMTRQQLNLSPSTFSFIFVGRLAPTKGMPYLIEAFANVVKEFPESRLLIVGEGRGRSEIEDMAERAGIRAAVELLGYRDDIPALLSACDAFVLGSIREGLPLVIAEAMAARLPVISTDAGGVREIVSSPDLGLVCPIQDSDALAEAMRRVVAMPPHERATLAQAGQDHVRDNFTHQKAIDRLKALYEELLIRRSGGEMIEA